MSAAKFVNLLFAIGCATATGNAFAEDPCDFDAHKSQLGELAECVSGSPLASTNERTVVDTVVLSRVLSRPSFICNAYCTIVPCSYKPIKFPYSYSSTESWTVSVSGSISIAISAKAALANVLLGALEVGQTVTATGNTTGTWSYSHTTALGAEVTQDACYNQTINFYSNKSSVSGRQVHEEVYEWDIGAPCAESIQITTCDSTSMSADAQRVTGEEVETILVRCCPAEINCCGRGPCPD